MIPRYAPTCNYSDIFRSLSNSRNFNFQSILEAKIRDYFDVRYVFILNSGKTALYTLLKAVNRPGSGVIMPAYNCNVVPEAVVFAGYTPVFVDVDCKTLNMPVGALEPLLIPDISVISPIHLFGIPCDIDTILALARRKNILVIEDAAPAMGAEYHHRLVETFGDAAVISFQSTKIISAETGGAILTHDAVFARKIEEILKIQTRPVSSTLLTLSMIARKLSTTLWIYPFASRVYSLYRREMMYEILSPRNSPPSGYLGKCSPFSVRLILQQWDRLFWTWQGDDG